MEGVAVLEVKSLAAVRSGDTRRQNRKIQDVLSSRSAVGCWPCFT
jgi:hypothetical protein